MANKLYYAYNIDPSRVKLVLDVSDIPLSMNLAIPSGLILNELISNALKYGFPGVQIEQGEITISLTAKTKNIISLIVQDNGIGLPEDLDIENSNSLGLKLVTTLVKNQLEGKMNVDRKNGTLFHIEFENTNK